MYELIFSAGAHVQFAFNDYIHMQSLIIKTIEVTDYTLGILYSKEMTKTTF